MIAALTARHAAGWLRDAPAGSAAMVCADCLDVLRTLPSGAVDGIVADPPWNRGKPYGRHTDALALESYVAWLGERLAACARVAAGRLVVLPGHEHLESLLETLRSLGVDTRAVLWWDMADSSGTVQGREPAVVTGRAAAPVDVLDLGCHRVGPRDGHPCPKPPALLRTLVELAVPVGGTLLDPFAGTGGALHAAVRAGRRGLGIEIDPGYCAVARMTPCAVGPGPG